MTRRRTLVTTSLLVASICLVTGVGTGLAFASVSQPGTVECRAVSGVIKFNPPLTSGGSSAEAAALRIAVKGCKASGGGLTPHVGKGFVVLTTTTNNCDDLTSGEIRGVALVIRWSPTKIGDSTLAFPGFTPVAGGKVGLSAGGAGTTVSGSYAGTDGGASSTLALISNLSATQEVKACQSVRGLRSVTIQEGTLVLQ
ncbi:MAG TPA: hypothetical protein VED63_06265 [Acidimicrobiales bacterium]|nr:hypothetical protein [Acidimicrobiales bacterium]